MTAKRREDGLRQLRAAAEAHAVSVARRRGMDVEAAKDAVQDVLVGVWQNRRDVDDAKVLDEVKAEIDRTLHSTNQRDRRRTKSLRLISEHHGELGTPSVDNAVRVARKRTDAQGFEPPKAGWHQEEPRGEWIGGSRDQAERAKAKMRADGHNDVGGVHVYSAPDDPIEEINAADAEAAERVVYFAELVAKSARRGARVPRSLVERVRSAYRAMRGHEPADAADVRRAHELERAVTFAHRIEPARGPNHITEAFATWAPPVDRPTFERLVRGSSIHKSGRGGKPLVRRVVLAFVNGTRGAGRSKLTDDEVWRG